MAELNCDSSLVNSGSPECDQRPGQVIGYVLTPTDAEIADVATAILEATWTTGTNLAEASRWYPIIFDKYRTDSTPTDDEPVLYEGNMANRRVKTRDGNNRDIITFSNMPKCLVKALKSYDRQKWKAYRITENKHIQGTSAAGTKLEPLTIKFFAGQHVKPASADEPWKMSYYIDLVDPNEWDKLGQWAIPTAFDPRELEGIKDVVLTLVSASTTEIVVDVTGYCDSVGFASLVTADWTLTINSTGAPVSISSCTESTSTTGCFTLAGTFTTVLHDLDLEQQPDSTTKNVESTGSIAVTPA